MAIIAMKQCTISSTTELSFIFTAVIWGDRIQDSNVSDMKFGWLDLFASRMSSYLNVLFTCLERAIGSMDANEDGLLDL
ncbi:hypothetical protein NC653_040304 [Populus alba x Populus x berolinensis]|uniref:Uncharacterized protein n=1 Tax=Populus alba x Populus x berolinensis TaxID=444605 RepID=A0AAD6LEX2_9ROSI|nr:hypothetical protein NC653_040304 [Populus alba x Populus x berolinensis]